MGVALFLLLHAALLYGGGAAPGAEAEAEGAEAEHPGSGAAEAAPSPADACDHADEDENVQVAYRLAKSGKFVDAQVCLRRAFHHFPWVAKLPTDLGRATLALAKGRGAAARQPGAAASASSQCAALQEGGSGAGAASCAPEALLTSESEPLDMADMLREACSAMHVGELLGDARAASLVVKCLARLRSAVAGSNSSADRVSRLLDFELLLDAARGFREEPHAAAQAICGQEARGGGFVTVSQAEAASGRLRLQTLHELYVRLLVCGVVELRGPMLRGDLLGRLAAAQRLALETHLERLRHTPPGSDLTEIDAHERWEKRHEVRVMPEPPFTDDGLVSTAPLLEVLRLTLGPRVEIDTLSHVTALPGAPDQPWHVDVDMLFKEATALGLGHHPPVGLVAVVPLANQTASMGPTEFIMGSHVFSGVDFWEHNEAAPPTPVMRPVLQAGSMLLFDLRVRHRGTRNTAGVPRAILYMSFVKDWFVDRLNFQDLQSAAWEALPRMKRKLLKRLDHRAFTAELARFAAEASPQLESEEGVAQAFRPAGRPRGVPPPRLASFHNEAELSL